MKRLFFSFSGADEWWKDNFVQRSWFGNRLAGIAICDYKRGDGLGFGSIDEWLENRIELSGVFLAIVSQNYIDSPICMEEWESGIKWKRQGH
jgi:hypothetical protein